MMTDRDALIDALRISAKLNKLTSLMPFEAGAIVNYVQELKEQIYVCKENEALAWDRCKDLIRVSFRQKQQIIELQKHVPKDRHVIPQEPV